MPFAASQREARIVRALRRLRLNPTAAYGVSIVAVAVATWARFALGGHVVSVAFVTFYPAIILTTFVGGLGPGVLAILLSALAAWYAFLPPEYSWALTGDAAVTLVAFLVVNGFMVALIAFLYDALERVLSREEEVRTLIEASPTGVIVVDDQGKVRLLNASAQKLFGYQRAELLGQNVEVLVPDRLVNAHEALRHAFLKAPEARPMGTNRDLNARCKDGSEIPIEVGLSPLRRDGKQFVIASVVDLSERRKAAEQQRILIAELQHRTQNLLAIISTIVRKSLSEKRPIPEARDLLLGRLQCLARAHSMLSDAMWRGAALSEIVRRELAPFSDNAEINGCDVVVGSSVAQNFALIVHELATNAAKHGALSVPGGRVAVEGKIERSDQEAVFSFRWREIGGPVTTTPMRKGFGTSILLEVAKALGEPTLEYKPNGLAYGLLVRVGTIESIKPPDRLQGA